MAFPRRIRLSLRASMVLILILAIWAAAIVNRARQQKRVVEAFARERGVVRYDWEFVDGKYTPGRSLPGPVWLRKAIGDDYFQEVVGVDFYPRGTWGEKMLKTRDAVKSLQAFPNLRHLRLSGVTYPLMETIGGLTDLESLVLYDSDVTDAGIAKLKGLTNLRRLAIIDVHSWSGRLSDESLKILEGFSQLEELSLEGNHFTDRGLAHLKALSKLKDVRLASLDSGPAITDAGLVHLMDLSRLEMAYFPGSDVTDAGLKALEGLTKLKKLRVTARQSSPMKEGVGRSRDAMPKPKSVRSESTP